MTRILIAGYQHETNTFAPSLADWAAFTRGDSFPAFVQGAAMQAQLTGVNIPIGMGRGGFSFKTILFLIAIYFIVKFVFGLDLLQVLNGGGMSVPGTPF